MIFTALYSPCYKVLRTTDRAALPTWSSFVRLTTDLVVSADYPYCSGKLPHLLSMKLRLDHVSVLR